MKSSESDCTHELASDLWREGGGGEGKGIFDEKEEEDIMISKNLIIFIWKMGNLKKPQKISLKKPIRNLNKF